jgi:hypothetical protein
LIVKLATPSKNIIIEKAKVERFIDLHTGLPLSMVKISYQGISYDEITRAFVEETSISFECKILRTEVLVSSISMNKKSRVEYVFQEKTSKVSCRYKSLRSEYKFGNERAILIPEDTRECPSNQLNLLRELPFIRLILREDIPKGYLLPFPRYS